MQSGPHHSTKNADSERRNACIEVSKEIHTNAVKEWPAKKAKRLDVSLFDDLVNKLQR